MCVQVESTTDKDGTPIKKRKATTLPRGSTNCKKAKLQRMSKARIAAAKERAHAILLSSRSETANQATDSDCESESDSSSTSELESLEMIEEQARQIALLEKKLKEKKKCKLIILIILLYLFNHAFLHQYLAPLSGHTLILMWSTIKGQCMVKGVTAIRQL